MTAPAKERSLPRTIARSESQDDTLSREERTRKRRGSYGDAVLDGETDRLQLAAVGERHNRLLGAARRIGRYVAGGEIDGEIARGRLVEMGLLIGLSRSEVERHVDRGLKFGKAEPRRAPANSGGMLQDRTDAVLYILRWWAAVQEDQRFQSRRGPTTLKILGGLAVLALGAGKVRVRESFAQLAEAAGVSIGTICKHRGDWGVYVRQVEPGNRVSGHASVWQLTIPGGRLGKNPEISGGKSLRVLSKAPASTTPLDPSANFFHGRSGWWRLLGLLDPEEPVAPAELAAAMGRRVDHTRRILRSLAEAGLAVKTEMGWCRVPGAVPPETERDWAVERKQRHDRQRNKYRRDQTRNKAEEEQMAELSDAQRQRQVKQQRANRIRRRAVDYEARRDHVGRQYGVVGAST